MEIWNNVTTLVAIIILLLTILIPLLKKLFNYFSKNHYKNNDLYSKSFDKLKLPDYKIKHLKKIQSKAIWGKYSPFKAEKLDMYKIVRSFIEADIYNLIPIKYFNIISYFFKIADLKIIQKYEFSSIKKMMFCVNILILFLIGISIYSLLNNSLTVNKIFTGINVSLFVFGWLYIKYLYRIFELQLKAISDDKDFLNLANVALNKIIKTENELNEKVNSDTTT